MMFTGFLRGRGQPWPCYPRPMRALALAAILLLFAFPALAQDITGPARIIDGDTIDVAGQRIRLHGIAGGGSMVLRHRGLG